MPVGLSSLAAPYRTESATEKRHINLSATATNFIFKLDGLY